MIPSPKIICEVLWEFYGEDVKKFIGKVVKVGILVGLLVIWAVLI